MFEIREDGPLQEDGKGLSGMMTAPGEVATVRTTMSPSGPIPGYGAGGALTGYGSASVPPSRRAMSWRNFWRQKWVILTVFVVGCGMTIPLIWLLIKPKYYAEAQVRIHPSTQRQVYKIEETGIMPFYPQFVNTNVMLLRSPAILEPVLDREEVKKTKWYSDPPRPLLKSVPAPPFERLLEDLVVANPRNSEMILIGFSAYDPKDAAVIVSAIRSEYLKAVDVQAREKTNNLVTSLAKRESELSESLKSLIRDRGEFTGKLGGSSLEDVQNMHAAERHRIEAEIEELQVAQKMASWEIEWLKGIQQGGGAPQAAGGAESREDEGTEAQSASAGSSGSSSGESAPPRLYWSDAEWVRLYRELESHKFALEQAHSQNMGEGHPTMIKLRSARDLAAARLSARESELQAQGPTALAAAARPDASLDPAARLSELQYIQQRNEQQIQLLKERLEREQEIIRQLGMASSELGIKDMDLQSFKSKHAAVNTRLEEVRTELMNAPGRIESLGEVVTSSKPRGDRRMIFSLAAVVGWLGLGLGIAYLRGAMDTSMSEVTDLTTTAHVPFLGQMPRFAPGTDALTDRSPMLLESIRMIRTALLERCAARQGYSVLITSPNVGSGKTTFAMLLARSLAHVGKRVLLVDADLRRFSLTQRLGAQDMLGLVDLLRNENMVTGDALHYTDQLGVDMIPTGRRATVDDAERMANGRFARLLKEWRSTYDFVVLDAPPVLPVADARILASQADGTIMAVRALQTRRAEAVEALAELSAAGARLFGTVLIGTDPRTGYYRGYDYGSLARRETTSTT